MRITKAIVGVALAGTLIGPFVAVAGPATAGPSEGARPAEAAPDPGSPTTRRITLDDADMVSPRKLQVEPTTGRFLVKADGGTRVFEPDGTLVGGVLSTEVVAAYGSLYQEAYASPTSSIVELDPATLEVTRSWSLPSGVFVGFGLHAAHGALYWLSIIPFSNDVNQYRLDRSTGTVETLRTYIDQAGFIGGGNQRVRVGWSESATPFFLSSGLGTVSSTATVPESKLGALGIAPDGKQVVAGIDLKPTEIVAVDITPGGLVDDGVRYPVAGTFGGLALGGGANAAVAVSSWLPGGTTHLLQVFPRNQTVPATQLATARSGPMAFSADASELFQLLPEPGNGDHTVEILVVDLRTSVGAAAPALVGRSGGATIEVPFDGVAPVGVTIGGIAAPSTVGDATIASSVPPLAPGTASIQVINALGHVSEAAAPLKVVELGPYGAVAPFVQRQYGDVLGRTATSAEVDAAIADLAAGDLAGSLPADLVRSRPLSAKDAALVRLYRAVFKRLPDTGGYRYWLGRLESGTTLAKAAATFAGSSEFKRTYGSLGNGPFIDLVYQNVLGRAPDPRGRTYWLKKLAAGTSRGTLVAQFSQSSEYTTKTTSTVERVRLVLAMIDRMPTQAELDFVAARTLEQVAQSLLVATQYPTA